MLVEDTAGDRFNKGVSNPGSIMSSSDLAKLVSADLSHRNFIRLGVVLDRNLCRHATHSSDLAPMASLDEQTNVGIHEGDGHGHIFSVRENSATVSPALLDEAEDVVPAKNRRYENRLSKIY